MHFFFLKNLLSEQSLELMGAKLHVLGREGGQKKLTSWEWKLYIK